MADRWKFADLAREAVRNVFGSGARLLPAIALAGLFGTGGVAILVLEQNALQNEVATLAEQGRGVVIFSEASPERPGYIGRGSCERLVDTNGVEAAGLVVFLTGTDADPFVVDAPTRRASSTLVHALGQADVVVGSTLAEHEGPFRVLAHGHMFDAVVAEPSREGTGTAYSLTFPLLPHDTVAGMCMAILDPIIHADDLVPTLATQLSVSGNPISGKEVLVHPSDPIEDYLTRLSRHTPLALGLIGGFITAVITRTRGSELAVYRLSGTSRSSLLTVMLVENLLIAGVAASATAIAGLMLASYLFDPVTAIVTGFALAGVWTVVASVATVDLPFRRPTDLAKDR